MEAQRERKVDLNSLSAEEADRLSKSMGDKMRLICDEAVEKANKILNIYNLKCKMAFQIDGLDQKSEKNTIEPKKERKSKKSNLKSE